MTEDEKHKKRSDAAKKAWKTIRSKKYSGIANSNQKTKAVRVKDLPKPKPKPKKYRSIDDEGQYGDANE